jgi:hypothetical protein
MRARTIFKKLEDGRIEKKDELTDKTEIINVDELTNEFEQFLDDFYSENYEKLVGNLNESKSKLSFLFFNYNHIIEQLFENYDEEIYFLESGCIFYEELKITTEEGKHIIVKSDSPHEKIIKYKNEIRQFLHQQFRKKKEKADNVFFEITSKIDNSENIDFVEMLKTLNEINTKVTKPSKPQWVLAAIEEGKLEKDGKTLRVSVEDMANWLFVNEVEGVDTNFMINNFRLRIKHSTAQQAVSRGKL